LPDKVGGLQDGRAKKVRRPWRHGRKYRGKPSRFVIPAKAGIQRADA
jgi:hypothetical protein